MSEQFSVNPGQVDPTSISEELLHQQDGIRGFVEARIEDTPLQDVWPNEYAQKFGLEPDAYDVYDDSEHPLGGGFKKFVSREDPSDTLVGLAWNHSGGSTSDPDTTAHSMLLKPNGDITGRIWRENSKGTADIPIDLPANSPDIETAKKYERHLGSMHDMAQRLAVPRAERLQPRTTRELTPRSREGLIGRIASRFLSR